MNDSVAAALIAGVFALIGTVFGKWWERSLSEPKTPESSLPFGNSVLNWLKLTKGASKKLARSKFIPVAGTSDALFRLLSSAKTNASILAICGYKGDFAMQYYKENFTKCTTVKRIFSYEAIRSEITSKKACRALNGLKLHMNANTGECIINVYLIKKGKRIKDMTNGTFDPPFSFGLAILLDGNESPQMAVVHWEIDAEPIRHLIGIEGVIIDNGQKELLTKLVVLHKTFVRSEHVLSSDMQLKEINNACAELEEQWKQQQSKRKSVK